MFSQLLEKYSKDLKSKTPRCKHEEGCLQCALRQALKGFALGYSFRTALNLLGVLTQLRSPSVILRAIFSLRSARFALLPGLYNSLMQAILCSLRRIGASESTASFFSGALAGAIALATKESKDRPIWSLFLLSRAIDCYYRSLINSGTIPKIKLDYAILFACLTVLPSYIFSIEPECTPPSLSKLY